MSKYGNCCYGVMTGSNRMFCSVQNCLCEEVLDCEDYEPIIKPKTNADRIRSMTDEELSAFLGSIVHDYGQGTAEIEGAGYVIDNWLDWLRQEAKP